MFSNRWLSTSTKIIIGLWLALIMVAYVPGKLEGNLYPVISDFSYSIQQSQYIENASDIYLNFTKLRPECGFRDIKFYLYNISDDGKETEQFVHMDSTFRGKEETRFKGVYKSVGPWVLMATPEQLKNMTIITYHYCHVGFYTISTFRIKDGVYIESDVSAIRVMN